MNRYNSFDSASSARVQTVPINLSNEPYNHGPPPTVHRFSSFSSSPHQQQPASLFVHTHYPSQLSHGMNAASAPHTTPLPRRTHQQSSPSSHDYDNHMIGQPGWGATQPSNYGRGRPLDNRRRSKAHRLQTLIQWIRGGHMSEQQGSPSRSQILLESIRSRNEKIAEYRSRAQMIPNSNRESRTSWFLEFPENENRVTRPGRTEPSNPRDLKLSDGKSFSFANFSTVLNRTNSYNDKVSPRNSRAPNFGADTIRPAQSSNDVFLRSTHPRGALKPTHSVRSKHSASHVNIRRHKEYRRYTSVQDVFRDKVVKHLLCCTNDPQTESYDVKSEAYRPSESIPQSNIIVATAKTNGHATDLHDGPTRNGQAPIQVHRSTSVHHRRDLQNGIKRQYSQQFKNKNSQNDNNNGFRTSDGQRFHSRQNLNPKYTWSEAPVKSYRSSNTNISNIISAVSSDAKFFENFSNLENRENDYSLFDELFERQRRFNRENSDSSRYSWPQSSYGTPTNNPVHLTPMANDNPISSISRPPSDQNRFNTPPNNDQYRIAQQNVMLPPNKPAKTTGQPTSTTQTPAESRKSTNNPWSKKLLPPLRRHPSSRSIAGLPRSVKNCLILDLDETLVHSTFIAPPSSANPFGRNGRKTVAKNARPADLTVPVPIDGVNHTVYVYIRPHAAAFLAAASALFETVLFTASLAKYADPVADYLATMAERHDGELRPSRPVFAARLFRQHCVLHQSTYVKDLGTLGRDLKRVVIVDNSPASFAFHPQNALPVQSWFGDRDDTELKDIIPFLKRLSVSDDVCATLKER